VVHNSNGRSKTGTDGRGRVAATAPATPAAAGRRARRREARRDAILRAAGQIFRQRGYAHTGMREIAAAAALSAADLYHYFRGKDEILFYCQDRALDRLSAAAADVQAAASGAADRLRRLLAAHVQTILDDVDGGTAHLHVESLSPALRARVVQKRDRYEQQVRRLVAEGVATGEFRPAPVDLTVRAMLGAVNSTVTWFRAGGPQRADEVAAATAEFLVRGLAPPASAPAPGNGRATSRAPRAAREPDPGRAAGAADAAAGSNGRRRR
jgi:AcrR family transcriptional regulator